MIGVFTSHKEARWLRSQAGRRRGEAAQTIGIQEEFRFPGTSRVAAETPEIEGLANTGSWAVQHRGAGRAPPKQA